MKRFLLHVLLSSCFAAVLLASCAGDPRELDNDELSALLSLTNVIKTEVRNPSNADEITGLIVDTTVINSGFDTINVPFRMTWALRRNGTTLASASRDFPARFSPGQSELVRLVLRFAPESDLSDVRDVVTFDLLDTQSLSPIGN